MKFQIFNLAISAMMLAACGGGGGGGVSSTPRPPHTPAPPSPSEPSINDSTVSRSYASLAQTIDASLGASDAVVADASSGSEAITVAYDAAQNSYTITTAAGSRTFGQSDLAESQTRLGSTFEVRDGDQIETLTIMNQPNRVPEGVPANSVGKGYYTSNDVSAPIGAGEYGAFVYGFRTKEAELPVSGLAQYEVDIIGYIAAVGEEMISFTGAGSFNVDFAQAAYNFIGNISTRNITSGTGNFFGGSIVSGGSLSSDGKFSGPVAFGSSYGLRGALNGAFYGPNVQEIGATFRAQSPDIELIGAMTGIRLETLRATDNFGDFTLTDFHVDQFWGGPLVQTWWSSLEDGPDGDFFRVFVPGSGAYIEVIDRKIARIATGYVYDLQQSDLVADGRENFTTYEFERDGFPARASLFRIGDANPQIQLTYTSFFQWDRGTSEPLPDGSFIYRTYREYGLFGSQTSGDLILARRGTAQYSGVLYAAGGDAAGNRYDITGESFFDMDFSSNQYSGWLEMRGTDQDMRATEFGRFTFAYDPEPFSVGFLSATITNPGGYENTGYITPYFYGPTGQELAATFETGFGNPESLDYIVIGGITLAKEN